MQRSNGLGCPAPIWYIYNTILILAAQGTLSKRGWKHFKIQGTRVAPLREYFLNMIEKLDQEISTVWLPKQDPKNDSTNWHANVSAVNLTTRWKSYRQTIVSEKGRHSLLQGQPLDKFSNSKQSALICSHTKCTQQVFINVFLAIVTKE